MTTATRLTVRGAAAVAIAIVLSGCLHFDVKHLSSDHFNGRNNNSPGGVAAREYLRNRLIGHTQGAVSGAVGPAAYEQVFPEGVNLLGVIPGTVRPHEYVVIGAHYDHHANCGSSNGDTVCNGATDNATGVAMVLEMAERFAADPPDRSVVFVLWDAEEDGLVGSRYYIDHPVIPLGQTVAYLNLDIQGANLLPTLRNTTFAIGAESGGDGLRAVVDDAYLGSSLDGVQLSAVFGLYRSDYAPFVAAGVATVFFTDSTGPCYHTPDDEAENVDFPKLDRQTAVLHHTASALAYADAYSGTFRTPTFEAGPIASYPDAVTLLSVIEQSIPDWHRFPTSLQDQALAHRDVLAGIVAEGPDQFDTADMSAVLNAASTAVNLLTYGECDGFLD